MRASDTETEIHRDSEIKERYSKREREDTETSVGLKVETIDYLQLCEKLRMRVVCRVEL